MAVKKILSELQIKKIFTLIKDNFAKLNHTHDKATTTADGFMAAADKVKLDGIETGANKYTHPTFTAKASGLVWCGVDLMPLKNGKTYVVEYNGSPGPMTDLNMNPEDVEKANEVFYSKFLETINKMC